MMGKMIAVLPGVFLVGLIAALAFLLGRYLGMSVTVVALLLGFLWANILQPSLRFTTGITWVETYGLATAVALLGVQLDLNLLMQINPISLAVITITILMTFVVTMLLAKWIKISAAESCLVASGQAICGSAAIMATSKVWHAEQVKVGLAIAVVNFLGFLGVFIMPWLVAHVTANNDIASGFLIGNSLQSMGHVVAAGFTVNDTVGHGAVLIKMCRILFLIPTLLLLVYFVNKSKVQSQNDTNYISAQVKKLDWLKLIPLFIWGFLAMMMFNNLGWINIEIEHILIQTGDVLFVLAMVAIGLSIRLRDIWQHGFKMLWLAGMVFVLQIVTTLLAVSFLF
jgi:uncharacterized integral membrane protein (TIGR00698 family)